MTKQISKHEYYTTNELLATRLNNYQIMFQMITTYRDQVITQPATMILTVADVRNMLKEFEAIEQENKERLLALGVSQPSE